MKYNPPQRITPDLSFSDFDCGNESLNTWLSKYALQADQAGSSITYLLYSSTSKLAGYYSISTGSVTYDVVTPRIQKGLGRYPVPVVVLTRLAVDQSLQGQGLGKALIKDCVIRTIKLSESIGIRALIAHAVDKSAVQFYSQCGFEESPVGSQQLMILLKDAKKTLS